VGNAFVDDTDATAATTFFFTTNGKSFGRDFIDRVLNMGGSSEGEGSGSGNDAVVP
jgi:hypothetical protein